MSDCYLCCRSRASIRCLICQRYFCFPCSDAHRHNHLLDALENRLTSHIAKLPSQFDERFYRQYCHAKDHLQAWINNIRRQFDRMVQDELEKYLTVQYESLKSKTDEYVQEYIQCLSHLRANVRYVKARPSDGNHDQELLRLISIEKALLQQFDDYDLQFRLDTYPIDFKKYTNIDKEFQESPVPPSLEFKYSLHQPLHTLSLQSTIQHIAGSCLDLFVFVLESPPRYPRLLEFSTSPKTSRLSLEHSIEFPHDTPIIDMCWSMRFNCLFLLTSFYLHQYDKYDQKVYAKVIQRSTFDEKWHRLTTNRFGIYILNENNAIEFYNPNFLRESIFNMKELLGEYCLVYELCGQADHLCTLTHTKENTWQIDIFYNRELEWTRTAQLPETLRPPMKFINGHRRNAWILIDSENHRLIVFDDRVKNIEHYSINVTPTNGALLEDKTLVIVSPDIPGSRLAFYASN